MHWCKVEGTGISPMFPTWVSEAMGRHHVNQGVEEVKDHDWERRKSLEFGMVYVCVTSE